MASLNSFSAFTHSIRRAANLKEIRPVLRTAFFGDEQDVTDEHRHLGHDDRSGDEAEPCQARNDSNEETPLLNGHPDDKVEALGSKLHASSHDRVQQLARQREESRAQQRGREIATLF
jgi:hypothetical protein